VGQISKIAGCRTVGIAGTQEKIDYVVNELGFDDGINYKTDNLDSALGAACPLGVDVYFDNVGGMVTDAVFGHLNVGARISICGSISQYNQDEPEPGPRNMGMLVRLQARAEGFLVGQFRNSFQEARQRIAGWMKEGRIKYKEDVVEGLENAPRAFIGLMQGENFGKLLVKVSEE
jgi:NADPH-dependent curcumin reductase CurA